MQEFLKNLDNKEILIEILHHSIDYLIGNSDDNHTLRMCHKYGFQNPDDFMLTTRTISNYYYNHCSDNKSNECGDLNNEFASLSPELRHLVPTVLAARRPEVMKYLVRRRNTQEHTLVESFDWDVRFVMGDCSFAENLRQLATVTLNCRTPNWKQSTLHFQMNEKKLDELIQILEEAASEKV